MYHGTILLCTTAPHGATPLPGPHSSSEESQGCPLAHKYLPAHVARLKTLVARNIPKYSMCTTSVEKLSTFCSERDKPQPCYRHSIQDGMFTVQVYVAKTCGWVTGDARPSESEAEENAAEALAKRQHLF